MRIGSLEIELLANVARLQRDMDRANRVVGDASASMSRAANAAKAALAGIGAGMGLVQLAQMSDQYAKFTAQLRLAALSSREYAAAYGDVKRISTAAQQDLGATGMLYARIANGTRELGTTQKQVAAITETVNLALKVSGASAAESASAQLQLSQAFASGTLRGEEFNAVNEAAPRLMLALADGIGVPVGALKKMAENGLITSKIMSDVLPNALLKLREEAKEVQTIAGAFTVLKNNMMEFVGVQANASGAVSLITGAIRMLSDNLSLLAGSMLTVMAVKFGNFLYGMISATIAAAAANKALIATNLANAVTSTQAASVVAAAKLAEAQATVRTTAAASALAIARVAELRASVLAAEGAVALAIATNGLIPAQARAVALANANAAALAAQAVAGNVATTAALASTAALAAQAATATIATRAMGFLRAAMAFLGGPVGLIITLLGAAATAWMVFGNKAKEASEKAAVAVDESTNEMIARLDKQIEKLRERNRLQDVEPRIKNLKDLSDADKDGLARAKAALDKNRTGPWDFRAQMADVDLAHNYETALKRVSEVQDEVAKSAARTKNADIAEWYGKYGTAAQRLAAELSELKAKFGEIPAAMEMQVRAKYADKGAATAIKQEASAYATLITSIKEKIAAGQLELSGNDKLTDAQKMAIKLDAEIATGKSKLSAGHIQEARAMIAAVAGQEVMIKTKKDEAEWAAISLAANAENLDGLSKATIQLRLDTQAQQDHNDRIGLSKIAIAELDAQRFEHLASLKDENAVLAEAIDWTGGMSQAYRDQAQALRERAGAVRVGGTKEGDIDVTRAKELLDIMTQVDEATKSAAASMEAAFGRVGSAIGGLTTALSGYGRAQAAIAAQLAAAKEDKDIDPAKIAKLEIAAAHASAQARMKSYGDISGAAKSFFKENSSGYKTLEKVEKAFRAMEMAMAIKAMITKLFATEAVTTAVVVGKTAEMGAMGAAAIVDTTTTGTSIANSVAKTTASTIAGVAKAFEQLGVWGFVGAAAILAYMGAFGGTGGGGPAATTFEEKQKKQGTGTVLGDDDAKSESIARSLEIMEGYAALELDYQSSMLTALRNIESALGGAAKNILQTTGITGGSAFGTQNSAEQNFFGSDKSTTILDSGVKFSGTFGNLRAGRGSGRQYEDVSQTSDGGWFHGNSTNNYTNTKALTADAMKPFALIFNNMGDLLVGAGVKLGKDAGQLTSVLNALPISFSVSLRNLKGQELADALSAGVSVAFDQVTKTLFPTILQFQKMGEGLGETLVRVATDVMAVDSVFAAMGKSTRLMALEAKELLVEAVGGLDKFASSASSFMKNFYSDADQQAATKARLSPVLSKFGLSTEGANAQEMFKNFVLGLNTSTLSGRETYATLMNLQQAFKDVTQAAADERLGLLDQLDELTMTQVQLLSKQRKALDPSNRALFDQIEALKAMREAQDSTKSSLGDVISRMKSFGDSARSLRDSLLMGALTTLTPEQQYAEARRQRDATRAAALGGDAAAQSNLSAMQTAFLTISQKVNGGDSQYSADFASVLQMSDDIAKWSSGQVDVAQASLDALNAQVLGIANLNATMLAVSGGIDQLAGTPNYSTMGTSDKEALVLEIRSLNTRLSEQTKVIEGLRADQQRQTGDLIASNGQVTLAAAERVVSGATEIEAESSWAARNPGKVALR